MTNIDAHTYRYTRSESGYVRLHTNVCRCIQVYAWDVCYASVSHLSAWRESVRHFDHQSMQKATVCPASTSFQPPPRLSAVDRARRGGHREFFVVHHLGSDILTPLWFGSSVGQLWICIGTAGITTSKISYINIKKDTWISIVRTLWLLPTLRNSQLDTRPSSCKLQNLSACNRDISGQSCTWFPIVCSPRSPSYTYVAITSNNMLSISLSSTSLIVFLFPTKTT